MQLTEKHSRPAGSVLYWESTIRGEGGAAMKYVGTVLAVADVHAARAFYEGLFGLEVYQDYGINVSFTCGLSL